MQRFQEFFEDHPFVGITVIVACLILASVEW